MKTLTAQRLSIQFETNVKAHPSKILTSMLEEINRTLRKDFPDSQPQITTDSEGHDPELDITLE